MIPNSSAPATLVAAVNAFNHGQLTQARAAAERFITEAPKDPRGHQLLGEVAYRMESFDEAADRFARAAKLDPKNAKCQMHLGLARYKQGRHTEAISKFDRALKLDPTLDNAVAGKAEAYIARGKYSMALKLLQRALKSGRDTPELAVLFATCALHEGDADAAVSAAERHIGRDDLHPLDEYRLQLMRGKALEKLGRIDDAFAAYRDGNNAAAGNFDPNTLTLLVDRIIRTFPRGEARPTSTNESELPVFIVSMPRAGSTLIEQILHAHPKVIGGGELTVVSRALASVPGRFAIDRTYPDSLRDLTVAQLDELAEVMLSEYRRLAGKAERIVDKNLLNYQDIGFLSMVLPKAKVIHCRRNPIDTCLSCFAEMLDPRNHPYATDLEHLGRTYNEYERLMRHYGEALSNDLLEIDYEELVREPEAVSRQVIEFLGLEWNDACLKPHKATRTVSTLSHSQVRQPVYRSSVGRAARFERHLTPLRSALEDRANTPA